VNLRAILAVAYATGRASHARQGKGDVPDNMGYPGPPSWGLSTGLETLSRENQTVANNSVMETGLHSWKRLGLRSKGANTVVWIEDIEKDIQLIGIRGWRKLSKERTEWRKITEKAKTNTGW
jgi:hypothetical protein